MASTLELGGEVLVHDGAGSLLRDETAWHHQHIGIIVLTDEMGNLRNPAETCADALMLVERHVDALTRTTDGDTREHLALLDALSQCMTEVAIVARVLGISAIVLILVALLFEVFLHELFQGKASVVARNSYCFYFHNPINFRHGLTRLSFRETLLFLRSKPCLF